MNELISNELMYGVLALVFGALISYVLTPIVMLLAVKVKAIDIPKDGRRMHSRPIPRLGGLAIFIAFELGVLIFCDLSNQVIGMLLGAVVIAGLGFADDILNLSPWLKLLFQGIAAAIPILCGNVISRISLFGYTIEFGKWGILFTVFWIIALTNAVNLIDGLDGLACGVASISSFSLLIITIMLAESNVAVIAAILFGSCVGFLPFNFNPAKIFMGDTGALTLGYVLSCISIQGLLKTQAMVSFFVPFLIFALPVADTTVAIIRRLIQGKSPFQADRGHLHHKLIDLGLSQRQSVTVLYAISGILAISSVIFLTSKLRAVVVIAIAIIFGVLNFRIFRHSNNVSSLDMMEHPDLSNDKPTADLGKDDSAE